MVWSLLTLAAKTIPRGTIVRRAADIIDAASSLLAKRGDRRSAGSTAAQTETQLGEIRSRLSELESHDQETAKVRLLTIFIGATLLIAAFAISTAVSRQ